MVASNGYLFYTSTSNFNLVHYNLGRIKPTQAGGLPPNPVTDNLELQALVDLVVHPESPDLIFYLQPHQIGKIVFDKEKAHWQVADDTETTLDGTIYLGTNRVLAASKTGRVLVGGRDQPTNRNYVAIYTKDFVLSGGAPTYFETSARLQKLVMFELHQIEFCLVVEHISKVHLCALTQHNLQVLKSVNTGRS